MVARDILIWFQVDIKIFMRFSYQAASEAVERKHGTITMFAMKVNFIIRDMAHACMTAENICAEMGKSVINKLTEIINNNEMIIEQS